MGEYALETVATVRDHSTISLTLHPDREGAFDWYAFDVRAAAPTEAGPLPNLRFSTPPGHVRFRGMPIRRA